MRFFEGGYDPPPRDHRVYGSRFDRSARYIHWEIHLQFPAPGRRVDFAIQELWYRAEGSVIAKQTWRTHVDATWPSSYHSHSWGWKNRGNWQVGSYRVDLYVQGQKIASGAFWFYNPPRAAASALGAGNRLAKEGKYQEAIPLYDRAIRFYPDYAQAWNNRCLAYSNLGNHDQAMADCNKAIQIDPDHYDAYNNRANLYMNKRQYDQAISDYTKAIELFPRYAAAYHNRSIGYYNTREYDKAWQDVQKAQKLGYRVNPATFEKMRKAAKAHEQPTQPSLTPEGSTEIERLAERISVGSKGAERQVKLGGDIVATHRGRRVFVEEAQRLHIESESCPFECPGYRGIWEVSREFFNLADIDLSSVQIVVPRVASEGLWVGFACKNGVAVCRHPRYSVDPTAGGKIPCKDRPACAQMAADLKQLVEIARKSGGGKSQ
jgi:tetratricopeptide (TPR) repeat protein